MANVVRHERYISVDIGYTTQAGNENKKGSNKQWLITVYDDGSTLVQFGKNTEGGLTGRSEKQHASVDAAMAFADKKIREKMTPETDKKTGMVTQYTKVNVVETKEGDRPRSVSASTSDLADIARKQIAQGDPVVAELVARLARENVHNIIAATGGKMNYDDTTGLFSTPMGVVTHDTIESARGVLSGITSYIDQGMFDDRRFIDGLQTYLRLIPSDLGYNRVTPRDIFPDLTAVARQSDVLDSLEASLKMVADRAAASGVEVPVEVEQPKVFDVKLELITDGKAMDKFRKLYRDTRKDQHVCAHLDVKRAFVVDIATMRAAFDAKGKPIGKVTQLWHGTRTANLLSILKAGLVIPPANAAHCSGRLFGTGVYLANASTKSLNYSYGYWNTSDGKGRTDNCFMFLADAAMGKHYTPTGSGGRSLPAGYDSIWAKAGVSGVQNDEIIVPHVYQCNLVYLLEFSRDGK